MNTTLKMKWLVVACSPIAVLVLAGCTNEGGQFAEASTYYALCRLAEGERCDMPIPNGATVETASVVTTGDAVRVSGVLHSQEECENYASKAKARSPGYVLQAVVNQTAVAPYGYGPLKSEIQSACATAPYNVSLTVAMAPKVPL